MLLGSPGQIVFDDLHLAASYFECVPYRYHGAHGLRVRGRWMAGAKILPGRLVVLVGDRLFHATLPLGKVVGIALARSGRSSYEEGDYVPVARRGVVVMDGSVPADLELARVTDGGLFVATGGATLEGAVSWRGSAVELSLA